MNMSHPREALVKAKILKEEGNKEFRKGNIGRAATIYNSAIQFVAVGFSSSDEEETLMTDLTISMNLNLAACCLRVNDFSSCINFCSYVMRFDVQNSKALFRRAKAYIGLQLWDEALNDLKQAIQIDPKNKDIESSLSTVEDCLGNKNSSVFKGKGKLCNDFLFETSQCDTKCLAVSSHSSLSHTKGTDVADASYNTENLRDSCTFSKKHQKPISELETDGVKPMEEDDYVLQPVSEASGGKKFDPLGLTKDKDLPSIKISFSFVDLRDLSTSVDQKDLHPPTSTTPVPPPCMTESTGKSSGDFNLDSIVEDASAHVATPPFVSMHCAGGGADPSSTKSPAGNLPPNCTFIGDKSGYRFFNKGQPNHSLKISWATYDRLLKGDSCEFYDKYKMCHMVVRIRRPESPTTGEEDFLDTTKLNTKSVFRHIDARNIKDDGDNPNANSSFHSTLKASQTQPPDDMIVDSKDTDSAGNAAQEEIKNMEATTNGKGSTFHLHSGVSLDFSQSFNLKNLGYTTNRALRRKKMHMRSSGFNIEHQQRVESPNRSEYVRSLGLKSKRTMFDPGDLERRSKIRVLSVTEMGLCIQPGYKIIGKGKIKGYCRYSVSLASSVS